MALSNGNAPTNVISSILSVILGSVIGWAVWLTRTAFTDKEQIARLDERTQKTDEAIAVLTGAVNRVDEKMDRLIERENK